MLRTLRIYIVLFVVVLVAFAAYHVAMRSVGDSAIDPDVQEPISAEEAVALAQQKAAVSQNTAAARYTHPGLGFSFEKPEGYVVGSIPNQDGTITLIVQPTDLKRNQEGFQIIASALDGPLELTPTLIKSELPGTTVSNPQKIVLDEIGKGIMFTSNNEAFGGKSFEIWFVASGHVYQITSYAGFASQLQSIIGTWKF